MKVLVCGMESAEDKSKKTGNDYAIGKLHALIPLDGRNVEGKFICRGSMGTEYSVEPILIKSLSQLPLPFEAELEMIDVMRYGKRETKVIACKPLQRVPTPVAAGRDLRTA